jgi:hypothetical protein
MCRLMLVVVACFCIISCHVERVGYVERANYDILQKQLAKAEADLKVALQELSECQPHEYQIYNEGFRTWRLDLVTGQKCILLTTEDDLKKPETLMQVCH